MASKTAILFGASGLIGGYLLQELLQDERYSKIILLSRKSVCKDNKKVIEIITGLEDKELLETHLHGDEIYCCLGTTIAKAGSRESFRKVDYDIPVLIGLVAKKNGVSKMLVISSLGADAKSSNFYLRTKGEMEQSLKSLGIPSLHFLRPSMLLGPRKESRPGETIGKIAMQALSFLLVGGLKKYKAIPANTVAKAMINIANLSHAEDSYDSDEIVIAGK